MKDDPDAPAELKARALKHLARREHSREELARKLAVHAGSRETLDALLDLLAEKKQLSDERYAEQRVHQLARKYGAGTKKTQRFYCRQHGCVWKFSAV